MNLIKFLLMMFGGPIVIIFLIWYTAWRKTKKNEIQISFNQFYSIYKGTTPEYWKIEESYHRNKYGISYERHNNNYSFYYETDTIYFKTLLDLIKFRIFIYKYKINDKKVQKNKIKQSLDERTARLMATWTRDIEKVRKNNIKELQKMINENTIKAEEYKKRLEELKIET